MFRQKCLETGCIEIETGYFLIIMKDRNPVS